MHTYYVCDVAHAMHTNAHVMLAVAHFASKGGWRPSRLLRHTCTPWESAQKKKKRGVVRRTSTRMIRKRTNLEWTMFGCSVCLPVLHGIQVGDELVRVHVVEVPLEGLALQPLAHQPPFANVAVPRTVQPGDVRSGHGGRWHTCQSHALACW